MPYISSKQPVAPAQPSAIHDSLPELARAFFAPLTQGCEGLASHLRCNDLTDRDWLVLGTLRALHDVRSGRAFLQEIAGPRFEATPDVSQFFATLRSGRRLDFCQEALRAMADRLKPSLGNPFAHRPELALFDIYAADGHWHGAACHDAKSPSGSACATGHFYSLCMRSGVAEHLTHAIGREHDMSAIERLGPEGLRRGAKKGRKVLIAWDKAGIDLPFWNRCKNLRGVYFLSMLKDNMVLTPEKDLPFDAGDPDNGGVISDQLCLSAGGEPVRLVVWLDPVSGETFKFITSERTLAPGLLAEIYRRRWQIEKAYDVFKNKLGARKSWGTTTEAKCAQAIFLCAAYNLSLLMDRQMQESGIAPEREIRRRHDRMDEETMKASRAGRAIPDLRACATRLTHTTVKFIRWLKYHVFSHASHDQARDALARSYAAA